MTSITVGKRGVGISGGVMVGGRGVGLSGGGGFAGAYDAIPSIAAAYGMRRLRSAYTGNLLRLRRSSDNTEQDFGYVANGDLDAAAIATFVGGGSGFVVTWYDQSGNARNATQSTAANQPLYVASGQNSKPTVRFDGTNDKLSIVAPDILRNVAGATALAIVKSTTDINRQVFIVETAVADTARFGIARERSVTGEDHHLAGRRLDADSAQVVGGGTINASNFSVDVAVVDYANSNAAMYKNAASVGSSTSFQTDGNTSDTASNAVTIGGVASGINHLNGDIAELIVANAAWSDVNRQAAESAANAYWSVY